MKESTTSRFVPIIVLAALLLVPTAAAAGGWGRPDLRLGLELGFIIPSEPAIYGDDLINLLEKPPYNLNVDYPLDSIISPNFTVYPGISQGLIWENGFGLVLTEKFTIMPLDIADFTVKFKRIIVPVTLTARYEFLRDRPWRPFIGAGPGLYYISSDIDVSGFNFDTQTQWAPGFHAVAGIDLFRRKKAGLTLDVRYEYFKVAEYTGFGELQDFVDSLGIANGGNGGGVIFGVGVTFQNLDFVPFKSKR